MARVKYVATSEAAGDAGEVLTNMEQRGTEVINLHRAIANSPGSLRNFLRLGTSLLIHGQLPPALRELAIFRISQTTGADYEWAHHVPIARQVGVTEEQLDHLKDWQTSEHFDDRARAVLRYVDTATADVAVPDAVFDAVRAHLSEGEIVELTLVCGYWGMVARLLLALEIDLEPSFRQFLPR
jgi:4-carboxymuconolactone decarboxylase